MYGLGIAKGLTVTLINLFKKPSTIQYPEEAVPQAPRFRGEEFVWYEERCTGCASCAKFCPLGIIRIVTHPGGIDVQEGESYAIDVFDIDIGRCMFCGLCVEACPYDALFMGSGFERGTYRREDLIIPVEELRQAEKRPSTWMRPQLESKEYRPQTGQPLSWEEVGR
jgi:NADH-quinone oxidoreductase subunit I